MKNKSKSNLHNLKNISMKKKYKQANKKNNTKTTE